MSKGDAILSKDHRYRFWLTRPRLYSIGPLFPDHATFVIIGINPSDADDEEDDPTSATACGFARHHHCDLLVMVNLRAFIATKPETMHRAAREGVDVVGKPMDVVMSPGIDFDWFPDKIGSPQGGQWSNKLALESAFRLARRRRGTVLAGWGRHGEKDDVAVVVELAKHAGVTLLCLGTNQDGSPTHPLYQPHETPLVPWDPAGWNPKGPKKRR